jgi:outer membrane protein OmpA-like peptidoglycan-associated protein
MSRKKRERKPKAAMGAPAYMAQYAALMTILLAFFILLLTMGREKVAEFKDGTGMIRNLVKLTGGSGVMDFWRSMRQPALPAQANPAEDAPEAMLIGYEADALDQFSLDVDGMDSVDFLDLSKTLRLRSSIRFEPGRIRVDRDSQFALDQAIAMLYALRQYQVVVGVMVDTGNPEEDRMLAAQRAAWLTRHITENAQVSRDRIRAVGMVRTLLDEETNEPIDVIFLLREDPGHG